MAAYNDDVTIQWCKKGGGQGRAIQWCKKGGGAGGKRVGGGLRGLESAPIIFWHNLKNYTSHPWSPHVPKHPPTTAMMMMMMIIIIIVVVVVVIIIIIK